MKLINLINRVIGTVLIVIAAQHAFADSAPIICVTEDLQTLSFRLDYEPNKYERAGYPGTAAELHPMNVVIMSVPVNIYVNPIQTRTAVGIRYRFDLPSGIVVQLNNIVTVPSGYEFQLGFKGFAYLPDGQELGLSCKQY